MGTGGATIDQLWALIVVGGKATRLGGVDKRKLVVDGKTIIDRQIAELSRFASAVVVSGRTPEPGYRNVTDAVPDLGPLSGIAAGLEVADVPWLFIVAGDMPRIHGDAIGIVVSHACDAVDAVGVRIGGRPEPLFCVLRVAAWRPVVRARLAARRLRVSELLTDEPLRVHWVDEAELRAVDPSMRAFHNVNTPEDL